MLASPSEVRLLQNRSLNLNGGRGADRNSDQARYQTLIEAVNAGWEIELPVDWRPIWNLAEKQTLAFHFVLTRDAGQVALVLSLPDSDSARRFIDDQGWTIRFNGDTNAHITA